MLEAIRNWFDTKLQILIDNNRIESSMMPRVVEKSGRKAMAHRPMPRRALAASGIGHAGGLPQLARSGVYQFLGSRGEKITLIDKEKLRISTADVPSKGKR
jgi:hypothetical protein